MDLGSILLITALGIIVAAFVAYPLVNQITEHVGKADIEMSALLAERDRLLDALLDLDFDQELGKVSEELYAEQRVRLMTQAAEVMAQLDVYLATHVDVDTLLQDRKSGKAGDALDDMISARRNRRTNAGESAGFCAECGEALKAQDKFCVSCGTRV